MQHNAHTVAFYFEQARRTNDPVIQVGAYQYAAWLRWETEQH